MATPMSFLGSVKLMNPVLSDIFIVTLMWIFVHRLCDAGIMSQNSNLLSCI